MWQPIETAPKDGTRILIVNDYGDVQTARWDDDRYAKKPKPFWTWGGMGKTWCRNSNPTHWMPLPEPPPQNDKAT